ncbi:MAG: hypothetical protein DSY85_06465 [Marinomonas sp.]|nr:MAG: hypothetical protein DSY85_06465 [Marinomonas sp.]
MFQSQILSEIKALLPINLGWRKGLRQSNRVGLSAAIGFVSLCLHNYNKSPRLIEFAMISPTARPKPLLGTSNQHGIDHLQGIQY